MAPPAGLEEFTDQQFAFMHGEDDHLGPGLERSEFAGSIDGVHDGQLIVEDGDVRLRFGHKFDGAPAVLGLGDHLPAGLVTQDGAEAGADDVMVIGNEAEHGQGSCHL